MASCKDKACVHMSKVKGVHHSVQIDHCSPLCVFMARTWWPVLLFASTLLCLSGSVWTSLQSSSVPSVFICFMLSLCLVVFLSGMPALTLSTTDLSVLKIIGKCHHSFSSAQSLQKRITLPPPPAYAQKTRPSSAVNQDNSIPCPTKPKMLIPSFHSKGINSMQLWH